MRILITGGAGYIGTELAYKLAEAEEVSSIVIYDNLSRGSYNLFLGLQKLPRQKMRLVNGDILDSRKLKAEVQAADVVFHLAAKVTTPFADHNPHEFDQVNNWGSAELGFLVEESDVQKVIYASSASVYGASNEELDLESPLNPRTFYGISKMHGEEHLRRLEKPGRELLLLRLGNVYGYSKSMRFDSVINKFMFEANFKGRLRIFGDGLQRRSFIQIDRLSSLLAEMALKPQDSGTYNLVESTYSINELVDELKTLYPALEMVFVNQNMPMRSMSVKPDPRLPSLATLCKPLAEDLRQMQGNFSF